MQIDICWIILSNCMCNIEVKKDGRLYNHDSGHRPQFAGSS